VHWTYWTPLVRAWFVFLADFHTVPLAEIGLFSVPLASTVFYSSWDQCLFCRGGTPLWFLASGSRNDFMRSLRQPTHIPNIFART
jgi:hypothetical protein